MGAAERRVSSVETTLKRGVSEFYLLRTSYPTGQCRTGSLSSAEVVENRVECIYTTHYTRGEVGEREIFEIDDLLEALFMHLT